jgi:hypothetical protein
MGEDRDSDIAHVVAGVPADRVAQGDGGIVLRFLAEPMVHDQMYVLLAGIQVS